MSTPSDAPLCAVCVPEPLIDEHACSECGHAIDAVECAENEGTCERCCYNLGHLRQR